MARNLIAVNGKLVTAQGNGITVDSQSKTVTPTANGVTVLPDDGNLLTSVVVNGDTNLKAENIKSGTSIFGVSGTHAGQKAEQSKTLTLGANAPETVSPDSGKVLSSVPVSIDTSVIKEENIKSGVKILGITGTHSGGITPSGTKQITENGTYDVAQFASANVNVQPTNFKQWTYESTGAATSVITTLVSGDNWVKAHYNDPNLVVSIRPKFAPAFGNGLRSILFAIGSNKPWLTNADGTYYSTHSRIASDTGAKVDYDRKYPLTSLNDLGDIGVDANGNIKLCTYVGNTYMLQAGDWSITAYIM